jgi:hypothetical protein
MNLDDGLKSSDFNLEAEKDNVQSELDVVANQLRNIFLKFSEFTI